VPAKRALSLPEAPEGQYESGKQGEKRREAPLETSWGTDSEELPKDYRHLAFWLVRKSMLTFDRNERSPWPESASEEPGELRLQIPALASLARALGDARRAVRVTRAGSP
jgi:hypothetical protein